MLAEWGTSLTTVSVVAPEGHLHTVPCGISAADTEQVSPSTEQ